MKVLSKVALFVCTLAALMCLLVACGAKVSDISIKKADMPRVTYVQGQELDLSAGKLTVKTKDATETVALDAEGVTVTGYDANTLGKQTLTVTYKGQTTEFTVNVVARLTAESVEKGYFIGEPFDKSKGHIKITKDDATTETVALSSDAVTVEGFRSDVAGEITLTVKYQEYTGSFTVKVHEVQTDTLHKPNKLDYLSHESGIDLTGGYIIFKSPDGELTRYRELTEDMVTGFDLSAATDANRTEPLKQKLSISYAGKVYDSFEISITYSDVSVLNQMLAALPTLDWTGENAPAITDEQGADAIDALKFYDALTTANRNLIDKTAIENVVRMVTVYGHNQWAAALATYANAFTISEDNTIQLVVKDLASVQAAYTALQDQSTALNVYGKLLNNIANDAEYKDITLWGSNVVGLYLSSVVAPKEFEGTIATMNFMLQIANAVKDIPDAWTLEGLEAHATALDGVFALISSSEYTKRANASLYLAVSSWRTENDLFDILYSYAYSAKNTTAIDTLKYIYLPGDIEALYEYIISAITEMSNLSGGKRLDISWLMFYYYEAIDTYSEIDKSTDEVQKYLLENLTFNNLLTSGGKAIDAGFSTLFSYIQTGTSGFYRSVGTLLANDPAGKVFNSYIEVFDKFVTEKDYLTSDAGKAAVAKLMLAYVQLSATEQYELIAVLNPFYTSGYPKNETGEARPFFDFGDGKYVNYLAYVLDQGAKGAVTTAAYPLTVKALLAMEAYADYQARWTSGATSEAFLNAMQEIKTTYEALDAADQASFNAFMGDFYTKYQAIVAHLQKTEATELGEWQATFDELKQYVFYVYQAYRASSEGTPMYSNLLASAERVFVLSEKIQNEAPAAVLAAYYNEHINSPFTSNGVQLTATMDAMVSFVRSYYISFLQNMQISNRMLLLYYINSNYSNVPGALSDTVYVIIGYQTGGYTDTTAPDVNHFTDLAEVKKALKAYRELSVSEKSFFLMIDTKNGFMQGLKLFYDKNLTEAATAVAVKLHAFESAYCSYLSDPNGVTSDGVTRLAAMQNALTALKTAYAALEGEDLASFNSCLQETYEYYLQAYEKTMNPTDSQTSAN